MILGTCTNAQARLDLTLRKHLSSGMVSLASADGDVSPRILFTTAAGCKSAALVRCRRCATLLGMATSDDSSTPRPVCSAKQVFNQISFFIDALI